MLGGRHWQRRARTYVQGDGERVLPGGPGAGVQAVRRHLRGPGPGRRVHQGDAGRAGAAHGGELLPAVPGAGAHVRAPRAHGPQRAHHPAHGPAGGRTPGAQGRPLDRRQPAARRARRQPRGPAAGSSDEIGCSIDRSGSYADQLNPWCSDLLRSCRR